MTSQLYQNHVTNNDRFLEDLIERRILPRRGVCFESGAWDGRFASSTFVLDWKYGWSSILVEPIHRMVERIAVHRPQAIAVAAAVSDRDGDKVEFVEVTGDRAGYSGVRARLEETSARARAAGWTKDEWRADDARHYTVTTISLNTLFERYNEGKAPTVMCLDMEGSEYTALSTFDFDKYGPQVITIEGSDCNTLLEAHGYVRVQNRFNTDAPWEQYFVRAALRQRHPRVWTELAESTNPQG
jgi:FkbM family methyltransferase